MKLTQQQKRLQREEKILLSLDKLNFATRHQLQIIERLGGDRNAQRILSRMEKDGALSVIKSEFNVYYLSNKGKERIGTAGKDLGKDKIKHTLMLNDLYINLGMPADWITEMPLSVNGEKVIMDARFTRNGQFNFVEVDNVQTMRTNQEKIKKYTEISRVFQEEHFHKPTIIWYTLSEIRKKKLEEMCEQQGLKYQIY